MAKNILIVDDSASFRKMVSLILRRAGYEVLEAGDGKEGLAKLDSDQKMQLIISDVNMPVMDGFEFLKAVLAHPLHRHTPVIMLTAEAAHAKSHGKIDGAGAWMTKPFDPPQILAVVKQLMEP